MSFSELSQPIVVAILLLAAFIFYRLALALFDNNISNKSNFKLWQKSINMCICALPLLGLLGTIVGLLTSFTAMANGQSLGASNQLTSGIASALFTTQLGLILAIPCWLFLSMVDRKLAREATYAN